MRTCVFFLVALSVGAKVLNFYSLEQEAELGLSMTAPVLAKSHATAHQDAREYVERLGKRIAGKMPSSPFKYRFAVIVEDSPESYGTHEPAMLPGGYIIVSEHLILAARNEAEFAGMLAHAMAHCAERHFTRMRTQREVERSSTYVGPDGVTTPYSQFAQAFEGEADVVATRAIAALGLSPASFGEYIRRTQVVIEHPSRSAMPTKEVRAALIRGALAKLPPPSYSSSDEFLSIQRQLR